MPGGTLAYREEEWRGAEMYHPGAFQAVTWQVALIRGAAWTLQMLPLVPSSRPSSLGTAEAGGGEGFSDRQAGSPGREVHKAFVLSVCAHCLRPT